MPTLKIILGSAGKQQEGWLSTDKDTLDVLHPDSFPNEIDAMLAEHLFEHLSIEDALHAFKNCYNHLKDGGYLRIAVPDGYHPNKEYIAYVSPPNMGHVTLFNYHNLQDLLAQAGFKVQLLEWFDEFHILHANAWNEKDGYIERCIANDPRNQDGKVRYTSLIVDAKKMTDEPGKPGLEKAFDFIRVHDMRGLSSYNRRKATTLYELARLAPAGGAIVELGCYHGFGTVPLWHGTRDGNQCEIIAVDAYTESRGWIGEPYVPEDEKVWHENMLKAKIYPMLCKGDARTLSSEWDNPISLLVHDLGSLDRMPRDVLDWEMHVVVGGYIAMRDLDDFRMGTEDAVNNLLSTGRWGKRRNWEAFYTSMERIR